MRFTKNGDLYLLGDFVESAALAPTENFTAYGSFDGTFDLITPSGDRIAPDGSVATLRPGEGRFGGAVAVEEGTTNLVLPNRLKFEDWGAYSGAQVTLTQNVEFPEIGRNDATRIRTTGGTSALKYHMSIEQSIADQAYTGSVYIKNIGSKTVRFITMLGPSVTVNPGEWTRAIVSGVGNGTTYLHFRFEALNAGDDLDFIAWGPQGERKPFATSFVAGTRAEGKLSYNLPLTNPHTGHLWMYAPYRIESVYYGGAAKDNSPLFELIDEATGYHLEFETYRNRPFIDPAIGTYTSHRHSNWIPEAHTWYGVTWKLLPDNFIVEVRDVSGNLIQTWDAPSSEFAGFNPTQLRLGVFGGAVLIDELLILPYAASEEEIDKIYRGTVARVHTNTALEIKGEIVESEALIDDHTAARMDRTGNLYIKGELVEE